MPAAQDTSAAKSGMERDKQDVAADIEALRNDFQNLKDTLGKVTNRQMDRAQSMARDTAADVEDSIRRNPLSAIAIAAGLGFLFGMMSRR